MSNKDQNQYILEKFRECVPIFEVMSDVVRQNIIVLLAEYEEGLNVNSITEALPLSRPAVSHHLKILKQAGILGCNKKGTENYYFLTLKNPVEKLKEVIRLIEINCELR